MKQKKSTIKFLKKKSKQTHQSNEVNSSKITNSNKKSNKNVNNKQRINKQDQLDLNEEDHGNFIKLKDNSKSHQDELKNLQRSDPEFYEFLQKNDTSLLDFNNDDDDDDYEQIDGVDDEDELDDDDDDDDDMEDDSEVDSAEDDDSDLEDGVIPNYRNQKEKKRIELTIDLISITASKALKSDSLTELKKLLSMFRSACIPNGDNSSDPSEASYNEEKQVSKYVIPSAEVYDKAMVASMDTICHVFGRLLGIKNLTNTTKSSLEQLHKHANWKKLQLCVVSYFKSILHTLEGLVASICTTVQSSDVTVFLIDSLEKYVPFLAPLPRLAKNVVKMLLNIWCQQSNSISTTNTSNPNSSSTGLSTEHLLVRGHAFLRIRQIATYLPGALAEECFRSIYLKFARHTKTYNEYTYSSEVFMMQSVAELYGTDLALAYQQSFLYIRQLALHLRAALLKKSDDTTRQITSMQYLNCLRLWTRVICCHPSDEQGLGALAFPLVQIVLGTISATTSIYYTPLKFNLIVCLHQIAASCKVFIPSTASILEVLEHSDMTSKTTGSTDLPPKIEYLVRFQANSISKSIVRDAIIQEAVQLLRQDIEIYRYHVGLPEYIYLTIRKLKSFLKKCKVTKWRDQVRILIGQMEQYSTQVQNARVLLTVHQKNHPIEMIEFEPLLPINTANAQIRLFKLITNNSKKDITIPDINDVTNRIHGASKTDNTNTNNTDQSTAAKDLFVTSYSTIKKQHDNLVKSKLKKQNIKESDNDNEDNNNDDDNNEVDSNNDDDDMEYDNHEFNQDVEGDEFEELNSEDMNDDTDDDEVITTNNNNNKHYKKKNKPINKNHKEDSVSKDKSVSEHNKKLKGRAAKDTAVSLETLQDIVDELHWDDD